MVVTQPALTARSLILAKPESTFNTDSLPVVGTDALLVSEADLSVDANVLERNFFRNSLSPLAISVGRKLVNFSFTHEIKASGTVGTASKIAMLLRGCGFATATKAAGNASQLLGDAIAASTNTGPTTTFAKTAAPTSKWGRYRITCVLGGASATAKFRVTGNPFDGDATYLPSEEFSASVYGVNPTTTITVNRTNPLSVTYLVATPQVGDIVTIVAGGVRFTYTIASTTAATEATAIAAVVHAHTLLDASASTATVTVTPQAATTAAGVVVTSGTTAVALGSGGATSIPTWTGTQILGDYWDIDVFQPGVHLTPISDNFESLTIYAYLDGIFHKITGCMGTVAFTCEAGNFGSARFTFTGQYLDPQHVELPTSGIVYEATIPQQVELAQLNMGEFSGIPAQSFSIDMGITVVPREDVNYSDGFNGTQITGRAPSGGMNPEAVPESAIPYWQRMKNATQMSFHARVGSVSGNMVRFFAPSVQLSGNTYADRNGNRVYDVGMRFSQFVGAGDDEIRIIFA